MGGGWLDEFNNDNWRRETKVAEEGVHAWPASYSLSALYLASTCFDDWVGAHCALCCTCWYYYYVQRVDDNGGSDDDDNIPYQCMYSSRWGYIVECGIIRANIKVATTRGIIETTATGNTFDGDKHMGSCMKMHL